MILVPFRFFWHPWHSWGRVHIDLNENSVRSAVWFENFCDFFIADLILLCIFCLIWWCWCFYIANCSTFPFTDSFFHSTFKIEICCHTFFCVLLLPHKFFPPLFPRKMNHKVTLFYLGSTQVIYPKYSKHWPYFLAFTMDCGAAKYQIMGYFFNLSCFGLKILLKLNWKLGFLQYQLNHFFYP